MFCKNCGKEIDDKAELCVYCGVPTKYVVRENEKTNGCAIAGLIISILSIWFGALFCISSVLGIILSVVGMKKSKVCTKYNGLAVAGLVIGIISLVIWGLVYIVGVMIVIMS